MILGFDKDYTTFKKAALAKGIFTSDMEQAYRDAKRGDPEAEYEIAQHCFELELEEQGLSFLVKSGLAGCAPAEYAVGKYILDYGEIQTESNKGYALTYNDPIIWLSKAAKHGSAAAAYTLAEREMAKEKPDLNAAADWYIRSDTLGGDCDYLLAAKICYERGDAGRALGLYKKAAWKGDREAMIAAGKICVEVGSLTQAKGFFDKAAAVYKDSELMLCLSECRERTEDIEGAYADLDQAATLLSEGDPEELSDKINEKLGDMCYYGRGTAENREKAATCYGRVKNFSNDQSKLNYGECKFLGVGTDRDLEYAVELGLPKALFDKYKEDRSRVDLLEKAAEQGLSEARHEFGKYLYEQGEYEKALAQLIEVYEEYEGDDFMIAVCYSKLDQPSNAVRFYAIAAEKGNSTAEMMVGRHYAAGYGIVKDPKEAFAWFKRSAMHGDPTGLYELGMCCKNGVGTAKNPLRGMQMISTAAENGSAPAMFELAGCLRIGSGVKQDKDAAVTNYMKSAELGYEPAIYQVGFLYEIGYITGERDLESALSYYKRCSPQYKDTAKRISACILEISAK